MMAMVLCVLVFCCALAVITSRTPLYGALWLIATLCGLACCFGYLEASLLAAMQLLIYAGAIMVLFLFVIMMLQLGPDPMPLVRLWPAARAFGAIALAYFAWRLLAAVSYYPATTMPIMPAVDATMLGLWFLQGDVLLFELVSILLLTAMVGSCVLGLRRKT